MALSFLESGLYDEAAQAFATAGNYQDAADKVKECYYQSASEKRWMRATM